jgi:dienelactone hydrolase
MVPATIGSQDSFKRPRTNYQGNFMPASSVALLRILLPAILAYSLLGCASSKGTDDRWFEPGPYQVGHSNEVVLYDAVQERDVTLQVAWPTSGGPFPVVVFSAGAFCYPQQYANITDFWVSHGYVVVLPNHLDSPNRGKIKPDEISKMLSARVQDMSFVLDSLGAIEVQVPELAGRIDADNAAVAGHSFGGMIAMVKSGLHMQNSSGELLEDYADPRFRAAIVMSGVGQVPPMANMPEVAYMTDAAFTGLTGPLIASGGTLDEGNVGTGVVYPWEWRMAPYTLAPAGDKYSLVLLDADHYLGGLICREDRGGPDDPEAVNTVRAAQTAFLDAYLKDDESAERWLQSTDFAALTAGRAELIYK